MLYNLRIFNKETALHRYCKHWSILHSSLRKKNSLAYNSE